MRAMLGSDGGSSASQCASAEPLTERREIVSDCGRGGRQRHGASEPAPSNERCPVTCIEPLCFGARRSPERRRGRLDTSGKYRAVCSRLMCFGVHTPPCRSDSFAPGQASSQFGQRPRIPSDSRHLLGLGQALLRRGKQKLGAERVPRPCRIRAAGRLRHSRAQRPRDSPSKLALPRSKPPALLVLRRSLATP